MNFVIDIIILLIFAYSIWKGHRQGFIKTLFSLIIRVVSFVVALIFAHPVSLIFADKILSGHPEATVRAVSYTAAFIIVYIVAHIAISIVSNVLDLISKLPLLNLANKTLGIAIGAALGFVTAWIFAIALNFIFPLLVSNYPDIFSANTLEETLLFKIVYNANILKPIYASIVQ